MTSCWLTTKGELAQNKLGVTVGPWKPDHYDMAALRYLIEHHSKLYLITSHVGESFFYRIYSTDSDLELRGTDLSEVLIDAVLRTA